MTRAGRPVQKEAFMQEAGDGPGRGETAFLAILAAVGAALVTSYAQDAAKWAVCFHSDAIKGVTCSAGAKIEAQNIGTLLVTLVAIGAAAAAAARGQVTEKAAVTTIVAALGGAIFSVLKAAAEGADYPKPDLLAVPAYLWGVCILLFAVPPFLLPRGGAGRGPALLLYRRLAAGIGIGLLLGLAAQLLAEGVWRILATPTATASKFIVPPSTTAAAGGGWAVALLDLWLRPRVWRDAGARRWAWTAVYAVGAVAMAAFYGVVMRDVAAGWPRVGSAVAICCLVLPGLAVAVATFTTGRDPTSSPRAAALCALLAGLAGAAGAAAVWAARLGTGLPTGRDVLPFVTSHALAAAAVVTTICAVHVLFRKRPGDGGATAATLRR